MIGEITEGEAYLENQMGYRESEDWYEEDGELGSGDLATPAGTDVEWWEQQGEDGEEVWRVPMAHAVEAALEDQEDLQMQIEAECEVDGEEVYKAEKEELEYDRERWNDYNEADA